MTRRALPFRQAEVTRAVKGALAAGLEIGRVECGLDGRIIITTTKGTALPVQDEAEAALAQWERQHGQG